MEYGIDPAEGPSIAVRSLVCTACGAIFQVQAPPGVEEKDMPPPPDRCSFCSPESA